MYLNLFFSIYSHALLSNYLTTILRPNFHKPLKSPKDLVENGVRVFDMPGYGYLSEILSASPDPWVQVCKQYKYILSDSCIAVLVL